MLDGKDQKDGSAREARSCRVWGEDRCWMGRARRTGALVQARSAAGHREVTATFRCSQALRPTLTPATRLPHHSYQRNCLF